MFSLKDAYKERKMKKGFTLIELLVVVLIIGILSSVALPQYTKAVEKSRCAEAESVLASLRVAAEECLLAGGGTNCGDTDNWSISIPESKNFTYTTVGGDDTNITLEARRTGDTYRLYKDAGPGSKPTVYCDGTDCAKVGFTKDYTENLMTVGSPKIR